MNNILSKKLKHVTLFFVLTATMTWGFYSAILFMGLRPYEGLGMAFLICGGMVPSLIGVIMALATYNKEGKKEFFKRFYQVKRIGAGWWLFILLIYPAIQACAILINQKLGGAMPEMAQMQVIIQSPVSIIPFLFFNLFSGAWPEEFGWRGFALQPLLDKFGFTKANLILGTIWCFWHLPLFFMPEQSHSQWWIEWGFVGLLIYLAQTIGLSMIICFVFVKTKQSILSALMLHMFCNATANLMFPNSVTYTMIQFLVVFAVGIILSIYMEVTKTSV